MIRLSMALWTDFRATPLTAAASGSVESKDPHVHVRFHAWDKWVNISFGVCNPRHARGVSRRRSHKSRIFVRRILRNARAKFPYWFVADMVFQTKNIIQIGRFYILNWTNFSLGMYAWLLQHHRDK